MTSEYFLWGKMYGFRVKRGYFGRRGRREIFVKCTSGTSRENVHICTHKYISNMSDFIYENSSSCTVRICINFILYFSKISFNSHKPYTLGSISRFFIQIFYFLNWFGQYLLGSFLWAWRIWASQKWSLLSSSWHSIPVPTQHWMY